MTFNLRSGLIVLALLLVAPPALALDVAPRIFDIVPPEGRKVQMVDGYTVIRLPGERFGAVLTFSPESSLTAWIPLVVLNSGDDELRVRESDLSAFYIRQPLKIYSNAALIREQKRRSAEMAAYAVEAEDMTLDEMVAKNRYINPGNPRRSTDPNTRGSREAIDLAKAQVEALRDRMFKDEKLAPGEINRGEIRVELPARRDDGPAEFTLRLDFGGQVTDVLYRERMPGVEVGEVLPGDAETAPEADASGE